jgi:FtsH-binding integral membrane protein
MTLGGAVLMWGTVILFDNDWLLGRLITQGDPDAFIKGTYSPWATGIFLVSTISTILWYVLACITPDRGTEKNLKMRVPWAILSTLPLIATVIFVFFNPNKEVEWLCILFFLIIGCLGYWLSTALNSPYPFQWIPHFSDELRQLFKID